VGFSELMARVDRSVRDIRGGPVVYTPGDGGDPVTVTGIFDAAYQRLDIGTAGVATQGPAVFLKLEDLPTDPETDTDATVTVNGTTYRAHEVQPDKMGTVRLLLHEVS
jgi:hypothetical protein